MLPNANIYGFFCHSFPERACRPKLRLGFAIISSVPPPRSVTAWLTSSSTGFSGGLGGLALCSHLTHPRLTFHTLFRAVSAGVFACPSGRGTPVAHFAGRCWISGEITLWLVGAVWDRVSHHNPTPPTSSTQQPMIVPIWLQFSGLLILRDPIDEDRPPDPGVVGMMPFGRRLHGSRVESGGLGPIDGSDASFKIAQRISCTFHRENEHANLKRAP